MTADRRECGVCWWVYDPDAGDDEAQVPPGVGFDELPASWVCPRCGAAKARFVRPGGEASADEEIVGRLVEAYRVVDGRMRGLPIHNPRLSVEAVGFRRHDGVLVGALVTPWFLNVVVVGPALPPRGEAVELALPGGRFQLRPTDEGVPHLALPLLSPMNAVANAAAARAVAVEALRLVLEGEPNGDAEARRVVGRRGLLAGLLGG